MLWKIVQAVVFAAVLFSNVHWQWTPNTYLASMIGVAVTFCFTASVSWLLRVSGLSR